LGAPRGSDWTKLLKSLPRRDEMPPGYLTIAEFSKRASISATSIFVSLRSGRISKRHCVALLNTKRLRLAINWNTAGYDFVLSRRKHFWPDDFKPNDAKIYRPIGSVEVDEAIRELPNGTNGTGETGVNYEAVIDIASAKYRVEQLKIAKMQAEIKLANNEVIPTEKVMAYERELALEIKASIRKAENKMAPLLAQANTVLECRAILEAYHREAFEALRPLETDSSNENK